MAKYQIEHAGRPDRTKSAGRWQRHWQPASEKLLSSGGGEPQTMPIARKDLTAFREKNPGQSLGPDFILVTVI